MKNKENAEKLLKACEDVVAANNALSQVLTEVAGQDVDKPEDVKEAMDGFGSLIQGLFGINVAMRKLASGLEKALRDEKKD